MIKHKKVYVDFFGIFPGEFIPCTCCGSPAVDIHHIDARGMGGSKLKDFIENLVALCRDCHLKAEAKTISAEVLTHLQAEKIKAHKANY